MRLLPWTRGLAAATILLAGCDSASTIDPPPPDPDPDPVYNDTPVALNAAVHDTGTTRLRLFNTGLYGGLNGASGTDAFAFNGANGLFGGDLLVGQSATQVSGSPYAAPSNASESDWALGSGLVAVEPPSGYDQAFRTRFTDEGPGNASPLGLRVTQWSASQHGDAFVALVYDVEATRGPLAGIYIGLFADFDVGSALQNRGGYDSATQTVYTYDTSGTNPNYYGITALAGPVSGWRNVLDYTTPPVPSARLFEALTTLGTPTEVDADRRSVLGTGPFALQPGTPQRVAFAYVAGTSLSDLLATAARARQRIPTLFR